MAITYPISVDNIFDAKDKEDKIIGKPYTFVVKSYQRGYRWEPIHINHLIEDLLYFEESVNEKGKTIEKKYCLQPIIIKEYNTENNEWELVDGQQRTLSLWLMRRVCFWFRDDPDEVDDLFYTFKFENKPDLQNLVDLICEKTKEPMSALTFTKRLKAEEEAGYTEYLYDYFGLTRGANIDVDCMMECIRAIIFYPKIKYALENIFISPKKTVPPKAKSILLVWYQLDNDSKTSEDDAITVFSNINANKIKLTESELIKAQILYNLRGLQQRDEEETKIAFRWEEIERTLCDDGFWYFLNAGDGKETGTRIDFLFEIWSKREDSEIGSVNKTDLPDGWEKSDYPLSDLIENTLKLADDKSGTALAIWGRICNLLDTLNDWKSDYYFYHMIGLIVSVNKISKSKFSAADIIQRCIQEYQKILSKDEFKDFLKTEVRMQMFGLIGQEKEKNFFNFINAVETLTYEENRDKINIRIVLLMHNIASLINAKNEHERFPFELFFTDHYDIEHVNPQTPDEENITALREWYEAMGLAYDSNKNVSELFKEAKTQADIMKMHNIGNLVLLDENTNRAYKNKSFFKKRNEIINILRTGKRKFGNDMEVERYIPIGTKWVFLKAFSDLEDTDKASIHHIWDGEEEYKKDLIKQLWILQSGYRHVGENIYYYEYDSRLGLVLSDIGLVVDDEGRYYYLELNDSKTEIVRRIGEIEIKGVSSNGLIPEGKYILTEEGTCISVKKSEDEV